MPTWLTLFLAILGTVAFLGGLYAVVYLVIEGRRAQASPRFGISGGSSPGILNFWVTWEVKQFALEIYRIKLSHATPGGANQEGVMSISYDPPQTVPFVQPFELTQDFSDAIQSAGPRGSIVTFEFRTTENFSLWKNLYSGKMQKLLSGAKTKSPSIELVLPLAQADHVTVSTLEYREWVARKSRISKLEAAAKAKAEKAAAAKVAAASAAAAPAAEVAAPVVIAAKAADKSS